MSHTLISNLLATALAVMVLVMLAVASCGGVAHPPRHRRAGPFAADDPGVREWSGSLGADVTKVCDATPTRPAGTLSGPGCPS